MIDSWDDYYGEVEDNFTCQIVKVSPPYNASGDVNVMVKITHTPTGRSYDMTVMDHTSPGWTPGVYSVRLESLSPVCRIDPSKDDTKYVKLHLMCDNYKVLCADLLFADLLFELEKEKPDLT